MSTTLTHARQQLLGVLDECWKGSAACGLPAGNCYFADEDSGLEQTLAGLSAQFAARVLGKTSIAGQVKHLGLSAVINAAWLRGENPEVDWDGQFITGVLDDAAWSQLLHDLWAGLAELRRELEAHALDSDERLTQAHSAVAHVVYHVGAIRAKYTSL